MAPSGRDRMTVCFVPAYTDGLPRTSASVRFRAEWLAKYWDRADLYPDCSIPFGQYDGYVFQKAYLTDWPRRAIRSLRAQGKLLAFDLCDADWKQGDTHLRRLLDMLPFFDFAVCPTQALKKWLDTYLPAHVIPDRLDLAEFPESLRRRRAPEDEIRAIWFGYAHNLLELDHIWPEIVPLLDEQDVSLTVLSNELPAEWQRRTWGTNRSPLWVRWTREEANWVIAQHDIALVPQRNPYKSDNRTTTAWALGVAPARSAAELYEMLDDGRRAERIERMYPEVRKTFDVRHSMAAWQGLLDHYAARRAVAHKSLETRGAE